jgi:hypothetical protein
LKYLFIVIPGTIVGDLIVDSLHIHLLEQEEVENQPKWQSLRFYGVTFLMLAICITLLIGLQARWLWQTSFQQDYGAMTGVMIIEHR